MSGGDGEVVDLYPPPPPYYKFFTAENVSKVNQWIKEYEDPVTHELLQVPEDELQFLIPPSRPEGETYRLFGNVWQFEDRMPTLTEMGVKQLFESEDGTSNEDQSSSLTRINELKKLFKSLLLNFLEIIGIVSKNPTLYPPKLEDIRIILINIHHLLNEYRPHQARESLILMLANQVQSKKNEIKKIEEACVTVRQRLEQVASSIQKTSQVADKESAANWNGQPAAEVADVISSVMSGGEEGEKN